MAENFYTILTKVGAGKIANAFALGTKVNLTQFAAGDSNGAYYNPTDTQTALVHEVWRGAIQSISVDPSNPNWLVVEVVVPTADGGFFVREAGVFDDAGDLIAVGKYPETYKPLVADGSAKDLLLKLVIQVSNTTPVTLKIDPSIVLATKDDLNALAGSGRTTETVKSASDAASAAAQSAAAVQQTVTTHLADTMYQTAGGTATAITLTISETLVNGFPMTFIASSANSGAATTINTKPLYKPNTTTAPNLIAGKAYTVWYSQSGNCFFIKASAEGTASVGDVLAGKTFSNDNDTGLVGTVPNNGVVTITPGTTDQALSGYYGVGSKVSGDANLLAANIIKGKAVFGVAGTKARSASGSGTTDGSGVATVRGLSFQPKTVVVKHSGYSGGLATCGDIDNDFYLLGSSSTGTMIFYSDGFQTPGTTRTNNSFSWWAWEEP
jgi:Phage-related tail fibre protein